MVIASLALFKGDLAGVAVFRAMLRDIARAFEYLRGFAPEAVLTCVLFSFLGYFNGHSRSNFVMAQGIAQAFLIRLPVSYVMSIQPGASLTGVGLAVPLSTVFGIALCLFYYRRMQRQQNAEIPAAVFDESEPVQQAFNPMSRRSSPLDAAMAPADARWGGWSLISWAYRSMIKTCWRQRRSAADCPCNTWPA